MRILAIETSCDETAVAVLECSGGLEKPVFNILGNALNSQIDIHKEFGGVVPDLAKREHQKWLPLLLEKVFKHVCLDLERPNIDLIAVTAGPGLEPALWAGITFAEELGKKWHLPVMPINHMEGHIMSVLYRTAVHPNDQYPMTNEVQFPALALLVSGGHTELVYVRNYGKYKILGQTRDDAVGEAFDKVARILGLPYPGGPEVARLAFLARKREENFRASRSATAREQRASSAEDDSGLRKSSSSELVFPQPMVNSGDLDFSYSGLKTAVLYKVKTLGDLSNEAKENIARAFEDAAIGELVEKTRQALESHEVKTLIVGGGVSANEYLREELKKLMIDFSETTLLFPERSLTTDNAIMIGIAAYIETLVDKKSPHAEIKAQGNLTF